MCPASQAFFVVLLDCWQTQLARTNLCPLHAVTCFCFILSQGQEESHKLTSSSLSSLIFLFWPTSQPGTGNSFLTKGWWKLLPSCGGCTRCLFIYLFIYLVIYFLGFGHATYHLLWAPLVSHLGTADTMHAVWLPSFIASFCFLCICASMCYLLSGT